MIACLATVFALAACGQQRAPGVRATQAGTPVAGAGAASSPVAGASAPPGAFNARARQVTAAWFRSPVAKVWRTGLVLLGSDQVTSISGNFGFADGAGKLAFQDGRYVLAGSLPVSPWSGAVGWRPGSSPLLTARQAFQRLAANRPCEYLPCGHLTVTGARPGTVTVTSNKGRLALPAWTFTLREMPYSVAEIALAPGSYAVLPDFTPTRWNDIGASVKSVSPDGRTLTLTIVTGDCVSAFGARVYQGSSAIVIGSWSRDRPGGCDLGMALRTVRVRLAAPVGHRVILDVGTGQPQPAGQANRERA
jgi:hypothetical protein